MEDPRATSEQENACDNDEQEFVWITELFEFGCLPEMWCPFPWIQYLLTLVGRANPDVLRALFDKESALMAENDEKLGDNDRPLTLFGQIDVNNWWFFAHAVIYEKKPLSWAESWLKAKSENLAVTAAQEYKDSWVCLRTNQEWHKVQRWETLHKNKANLEPVSPFNPVLTQLMSPQMKQQFEENENKNQGEHIEVLTPEQIKLETPRFDPFTDLTIWRYPYTTPRIVERLSSHDGVDHALWSKGVPIGVFAPPTVETWLGMAASASQDRPARYKRLLSKVDVNAKECVMLTRDKHQFGDWNCQNFQLNCDQPAFIWTKRSTSAMKAYGSTTAVLWSQIRPFVKCQCFQDRMDCGARQKLAWLDCVLWFVMNHLDVFFTDKPTAPDRVVAFLDLLRSHELHVVQLCVAQKVHNWMHAGVRAVLNRPANPDFSCIPIGPTRRLIADILAPKTLSDEQLDVIDGGHGGDDPDDETPKRKKGGGNFSATSKGKNRTSSSTTDECSTPAKRTKDETKRPTPSKNLNKMRGKGRK